MIHVNDTLSLDDDIYPGNHDNNQLTIRAGRLLQCYKYSLTFLDVTELGDKRKSEGNLILEISN